MANSRRSTEMDTNHLRIAIHTAQGKKKKKTKDSELIFVRTRAKEVMILPVYYVYGTNTTVC